ncbi:MAG: serine--tRNA ligase [Rhizobiales bacterium PAR1]|nr:MAG: serine--tRNA ligase [Rhizobiales bacterium PAR1]
MHDIRALRENPAALKDAMLRRNKPEEASKVEAVLALDIDYRARLTEKETLLARRNAASKEIGQAMAQKDAAKAEALKAEVAAGKERLAALEGETAGMEAQIRDILSGIPNVPNADVPEGADEHGNVVVAGPKQHAEIAGGALPIPAKRIETGSDHVALGEALGMMDFETAAKLSGARFVVLQKGLARLERALGQFMLDTHTMEHGYTEVNPPILVKDDAMFGTAQLPKFREDQFASIYQISIADDEFEVHPMEVPGQIDVRFLGPRKAELERAFTGRVDLNNPKIGEDGKIVGIRPVLQSNYWLIPTAEVPLTNLVREKILSEEELPLRFTALTPCFRAEAGSAGRDTRGMLRQHQFNKVELVSITTPETSANEHERMITCAETVLKKLGLHFRTMTLCTGDMGFASQKTYDIEVWLPGQNTYREISSCSVCGDFQARRMDARFRAAGEKQTRFVHTLNGSGVAVGRCLIAVMENYQNPDGSITVPDVLLPYMGGIKRIER